MPLNGILLGTELKIAVDDFIGGLTDEQKQNMNEAQRLLMYQEMGKAIVAHIQANALVNTTGIATGVMPGPGTAPTTAFGTVA